MYLYLDYEQATNLRLVLNQKIISLIDREIALIKEDCEIDANILNNFRKNLESIEEQLKYFCEHERK